MLSKQQIAFKWSAERLRNTTGKIYLWTFTWKESYHVWQYAYLWDKFVKALEHIGEPGIFGIRVAQMHPGTMFTHGKSHGIHYHCLINQYLDSRIVWRLCRRMGMGCNAKKIPQNQWQGAVAYVSRYLTRDSIKIPLERFRVVGSMWGFPMDTKSEIQLNSPTTDSLSYLTKFWGRGQFGSEQIIAACNSINCYGDFRTLLCAFDYKEYKRMESFTWTEKRCWQAVNEEPYSNWIAPEATIYEPHFMPRLLKFNMPESFAM